MESLTRGIDVEPRPVRRRGRTVAGVFAVLVTLGLIGMLAWRFIPWEGTPLPEEERRNLLAQSGLPLDFPVHPNARRASQPQKGGMIYTIYAPVPDVLTWHQHMLIATGYEIFSADVAGQDEFLPHWLYFKHTRGVTGAIIIRSEGPGLLQGTEVKVLSTADARLAAPPLPTSPSSPGAPR